MKLSKEELLHILVSVVTISLAFSFVMSGVSIGGEGVFDPGSFVLILLTVGVGFVFHELGHKYVAIKYGCQAEYRAWTTGLFIALFLAVFAGFVFAAPGAVYIFGRHVTREQNGKIAFAGPFVNFMLVVLFLLMWIFSPKPSFLADIGWFGAYVNSFLGAFNLLPFGPLDGNKVMQWNTLAWGALFLTFVALLSFFIL
ncbi:MAG: site-2 protease family protein [Candidatus Micrarchaeota archaeon]